MKIDDTFVSSQVGGEGVVRVFMKSDFKRWCGAEI